MHVVDVKVPRELYRFPGVWRIGGLPYLGKDQELRGRVALALCSCHVERCHSEWRCLCIRGVCESL